MQRSVRSGALAAILVLALGACAGSDDASDEDITERIADQLSSDGGLDAEAAECVAGVIVDELGVDAVEDVDFAAEEPPDALQEEIAGAMVLARDTCDVDLDSLQD